MEIIYCLGYHQGLLGGRASDINLNLERIHPTNELMNILLLKRKDNLEELKERF